MMSWNGTRVICFGWEPDRSLMGLSGPSIHVEVRSGLILLKKLERPKVGVGLTAPERNCRIVQPARWVASKKVAHFRAR